MRTKKRHYFEYKLKRYPICVPGSEAVASVNLLNFHLLNPLKSILNVMMMDINEFKITCFLLKTIKSFGKILL